MRRALYSSISIAALICVGAANAAPLQLKGQYALTGSAFCLDGPWGFTPDFRPNPPPVTNPPTSGGVSFHTFGVEGVRTFNGDGTGSVKVRVVNLNQGGASSGDFVAQFTYAVDADGFVSTHIVPGTAITTNLTGPGAGVQTSLDRLSLSGLISADGRTLMLATVEPEVETSTVLTGPAAGHVHQAICYRSRVLVRLGDPIGDRTGEHD